MFILCCLFVFLFSNVMSQEYTAIGLKDVLTQCGANNATIKLYNSKIEIAEAQLQKDKEWWLPGIFFWCTDTSAFRGCYEW